MSGGGELAVLEQIAMYLTALPVPPLPVWTPDEVVASSHDVLAGLLVVAMERRRPDLDAERRGQQERIVRELVQTMDKERVPHTPEEEAGFGERALQAYRRFTADFIVAFQAHIHLRALPVCGCRSLSDTWWWFAGSGRALAGRALRADGRRGQGRQAAPRVRLLHGGAGHPARAR